jgi:hypothetical protein
MADFRVRGVASRGKSVEASAEIPWDETYGPDLVDAVLDMLLDGVRGPLSFQSADRVSVVEFTRRLAETAYCDPTLARETALPRLRAVRDNVKSQIRSTFCLQRKPPSSASFMSGAGLGTRGLRMPRSPAGKASLENASEGRTPFGALDCQRRDPARPAPVRARRPQAPIGFVRQVQYVRSKRFQAAHPGDCSRTGRGVLAAGNRPCALSNRGANLPTAMSVDGDQSEDFFAKF